VDTDVLALTQPNKKEGEKTKIVVKGRAAVDPASELQDRAHVLEEGVSLYIYIYNTSASIYLSFILLDRLDSF
jgi:hypothetical protein